jgi:hypothetical protein
MTDLTQELDAIEAQEAKKAAMLTKLLDGVLNATDALMVTRGEMGHTTSFHGTVSLAWIDKTVMLFTQLPLFKNKVNDQGNFIVDEGTAADLRQRAPNWTRQPLLVNYLIRQRTRFFPPMLVVVEEDWVNDDEAPEWVVGDDGEKRASRTSFRFTPLDSRERVGTADLSRATVFVIDGSHRWMGISGLMELIRTGHLTLKKKDGAATGKVQQLHDLAEQFDIDAAAVPAMQHETMGIELIPAVMKGESREEARRRIRSVFVHVNKSAEPPTASEQALLDEDDGFAVVGRETAFDHPLFRYKTPGDRVNWKGTALPEGSSWLTTGKTLRDSVEAYLGKDEAFSRWATSSAKEIAVRPSEDALEDGKDVWKTYLDHLQDLPSFADILRGGRLDQWRAFPTPREPGNRGHLLMRPLGQLILADATGYLHLHPNGPQMSLDEIFGKLKRYEGKGGFENVHETTSDWWGITYDQQRQTMYMGGRKVGVMLLRHLLGDDTLENEDRAWLRTEFARLRTVMPGGDSYDWDGTRVSDPEAVQLPPLL